MIAPDINAKPVCCAKCGEALQVICPTHGEGFVIGEPISPRTTEFRRPSETPSASSAPLPNAAARTRKVIGKRLLSMMSTDPARPTGADDLVACFDITRAHANVLLSVATQRGEIERVGVGQYVRVAAGGP